MLLPNKPSRILRSSSKRVLTITSAKLKQYGCRSSSFAASLPEPIRNHDNISKFKTSINNFLFKES